ncbi:MAG TPA: FkbM family methyltransferase [Hyphomicrobiaceae bacterium]|nr:FkbM family methyltransferase [Hyphomicrobiaceae bacterium]
MADTPDRSVPFGHYAPSPLQSRLIALGHAMPRTWVGRRVTSLIRSFLKRWSERPIDAVRLGSRMRLHPRGNASEKRLMTSPQFFDPAELGVLESMLAPGFVFFDIGANVGAYTLFVANRVGRSGTIVAVEPHPTALKRLKCNLELNGIDWVRIAPVALAESAGTLSLYINDRNIGTSSLTAVSADAKSAIEVPCRTLLSLVEEEGVRKIDAIKIDVEGVEDRVLMPYFASASDDKWPRLLVIEDNREAWKQDLLGMLQRIGYVTAARPVGNLVLQRESGARK